MSPDFNPIQKNAASHEYCARVETIKPEMCENIKMKHRPVATTIEYKKSNRLKKKTKNNKQTDESGKTASKVGAQIIIFGNLLLARLG